MTYIPRQRVTDLIPNKFEAIKVAALEARRLNARARTLSINLPGKITTMAVNRLLDGKVSYYDRREREAQLKAERKAEAAQQQQGPREE